MNTPHVTIQKLDAQGNVLETFQGPSLEELKELHDKAECGAFCGYCYDEACKMRDAERAKLAII